jgi:NAD(P)H-dependent FMN reductase
VRARRSVGPGRRALRPRTAAATCASGSYGGLAGGLRAVEHLRQVFAELHAVTIRDTVSFHNAGASFDDEGHLKDPSMPDAAVKVMLDQLVWWGRGLREAREKRPYGQ